MMMKTTAMIMMMMNDEDDGSDVRYLTFPIGTSFSDSVFSMKHCKRLKVNKMSLQTSLSFKSDFLIKGKVLLIFLFKLLCKTHVL